MSGKDLIKLLKKNGWSVIRIRGSHHILGKLGRSDTVTVAVHGSTDIAIGTLSVILKQAGLK